MLEIIDKFYKSRTNPPSPPATDRMSSSTNLIDRSSPPQPHNRSHIIIHDRDQITIDIGWWGWAGSFTISGIW